MKNREENLKEAYEDAYFKLLMSKIAKEEGAELIKLNEQLEKDPQYEVPESVTKACLEAIRKENAKTKRSATRQATGRWLVRVACVAAIAGAMLVSCYAVFPDFRTAALNLLIQSSDVASKLIMTDKDVEEVPTEVDLGTVLMGYRIPVMPLGFSLNGEKCSDGRAWIEYGNKEGGWIKFSFYENTEYRITYDDEKTQKEPIQIQDHDAMLYRKNDCIKILWNDTDTGMFIVVTSEGLDKESVLRFANGICSTQ